MSKNSEYFKVLAYAIVRSKTRMERKRKSVRQSTVEQVFGTLIKHLGICKMNTIGIRQANKSMLLSSVAYNLKKYLKFERKTKIQTAKAVKDLCLEITHEIRMVLSPIVTFNFLKPIISQSKDILIDRLCWSINNTKYQLCNRHNGEHPLGSCVNIKLSSGRQQRGLKTYVSRVVAVKYESTTTG